MPTEIEAAYSQWLAAERAWSEHTAANPDSTECDHQGPLSARVDELYTALLAQPVTNDRDALCILAARCATHGLLFPDPTDPKTTEPGSALATFRAIGFPVRDW